MEQYVNILTKDIQSKEDWIYYLSLGGFKILYLLKDKTFSDEEYFKTLVKEEYLIKIQNKEVNK